MADGGFRILDLDAVRAALELIMTTNGGSRFDEMYADLTEHGKGFLLGYVNGYAECLAHVSAADSTPQFQNEIDIM